MSEKNGQFDFCPKCGALSRDGECQSCGYQLEAAKIQRQAPVMQTYNMNSTNEAGTFNNAGISYGSYADQYYINNTDQGYQNTSQGPDPMNQGYYSASQGPDPMNQGYSGASQGPDPMNQGYYSTSQGPDPMNQGNNSASQGPDPMNQGYYSTSQGPDPINQGNNSASQGPGNMNQGYNGASQGDYMNQGYNGATQGFNNANQTYSNMNQSGQPNYQPVPNYVPYKQAKAKNNNTAVIIAISAGAFLILLCLIIGGITAYNVRTTRLVNTDDVIDVPPIPENPDDIEGEDKDSGDAQEDSGLGKAEEKRKEDGQTDAYKNASEDDFFLEPGYINTWGGNHVNHTKAEFSGEYYNNVCECIDYNVSYKINREYYEYISPDTNIAIRLAYIQLEGDIPNIDQLNDQILSYSAYLADYYFESYSEEEVYDGWVDMMTDSYVVYNDESKMSIVLDENWMIDEEYSMNLYAINIDLETGMILGNDTILDLTDEFSAEFRARSNEQNGKAEGMDMLTDGEITAFLADTSSSIIFYTPIGMEVGYNYYYEDISGWVTASFADYMDYVKQI